MPGIPFTTETAKAAAAASAEARRERAIEPQGLNGVDSAYLGKRLLRVRTQIDRLSALIDEEIDPQKIDRLVSALYRLTELERVIAGRPLPGQLKPVQRSISRPSVEPIR